MGQIRQAQQWCVTKVLMEYADTASMTFGTRKTTTQILMPALMQRWQCRYDNSRTDAMGMMTDANGMMATRGKGEKQEGQSCR